MKGWGFKIVDKNIRRWDSGGTTEKGLIPAA